MTEPRLIAYATYASRPWRNGQGVSRDIASGEGWQLSLADIERSGRFSDFAGSLRLFAIVAGAVVLHLPRGRLLACDATSPVVAFDGGEPPDCEVVADPARALNLIVPAGTAARLERLTLEPGVDLAVGDGDDQNLDGAASLVFMQSGAVECRPQRESGEPGGADTAGGSAGQARHGGVVETAGRGYLRAGAGDSLVATGTGPGKRLLLRAVDGQRAQALVATIRGRRHG